MEQAAAAYAGAAPCSPQSDHLLPFVALTHDISASVASILLSPSSRSIHPHLFQAWNFTPSPRAPSPPPSAHRFPSPPPAQQLSESAHSSQPAQPEQPLEYGCFFSTPPISLAPPAVPIIPGIAYTPAASAASASGCPYLSVLPAPPCAADLAQSKKDQPLRAEGNSWEADGYRRAGQGEVVTEVVKQPLQRSLSPSRERRKSVLRSNSGDGGSSSARAFAGATESSSYGKLPSTGVTVSGPRTAPSCGESRTSGAGSLLEQFASIFTRQPSKVAAVAPCTGASDRAAAIRAPLGSAKPPRPPSRQSLLPSPAPRRSETRGMGGFFGRKEHRQGKSARSRSGMCGGSKGGQAGGGGEGVMLPMLLLLVALFFVLTFVQHIWSPEQSALIAADEARARSGSGEYSDSWEILWNRSNPSNGGISASDAWSSAAAAATAAASRTGQNRKLGRAPVAAPEAASGMKAEGAGLESRDAGVAGGAAEEGGALGLGELGSIEVGGGWGWAAGRAEWGAGK
ncbi:hypothetical protein CLOP_g17245 [Closterium sp. NIES-67]|nr:hypothetical protein CLOP_g17245 [Closterium sp. NIES-67]